MVSLRKRYRPESSGREAPPVQTTPSVAPVVEPPVDAAPLPGQPGTEPDAVKEAADSAIKQRLREMERAETLAAEAPPIQQRMATERPKQQQAPQAPAHIQAWV